MIAPDERRIRVLLVDDQVFNLILLENLIQSSFPNAQFEQALNGKLALDKVIEFDRAGTPFEMIFMDINMPEMDGIESSAQITTQFKQGKISSKPFIAAITAYTSEEMKFKSMSNGMEKFLTKPANTQVIYNMIKKFIDARERNWSQPSKMVSISSLAR